MSVLASYLVISILSVAGGVASGWWIRRRVSLEEVERDDRYDNVIAREMLSRVQGLAKRMAADVHEHSDSVAHVDQQLQDRVVGRDPAIVIKAVAQLIDANEKVQKKLSATETRLEDLTRQLETHAKEARTDPLTGLSNRRAFDEEIVRRFEGFQQRDEAFAMVMLDVDHFKTVNDRFGHQSGDQVLCGIARILRDHMRGKDFIARYGGEEFVVLMPGLSVAHARRGAETIRHAIANARFLTSDHQVHVTASIGVAEIVPYEDQVELIKRSDQAMYAAKHAGRNAVYWHDGTLSHPHRTESDHGSDPQNSLVGAFPVIDEVEDDPENELLSSPPADQEVLSNMGNKTIVCQEIRRRLADSQRGGDSFTVLLLELRNIEQIAVEYGEKAADSVLCAIAHSLENGIRDMDLIARYRDDVFAVVMPRTTEREAVVIAQRVRKTIGRNFILADGQQAMVELRMGFAESEDGDEVASLLERASATLSIREKATPAAS